MAVKFKDERHDVDGVWFVGEDIHGGLYKVHTRAYIFASDRTKYITKQNYVVANDELEAYQKARRGEWRGLR